MTRIMLAKKPTPVLPTLDAAAVTALVRGEHGDPFALLGPHLDPVSGLVSIRCFRPDLPREVPTIPVIESTSGKVVAELSRVHEDGFFAGPVPGWNQPLPYRLRLAFGEATVEIEDAYAFPPVLGELDVHLLAEGKHLEAYEHLGAHATEVDGIPGTTFAVWAPNARRVSVVGDFCAWDGRRLPMRCRHECGVWELFVPRVAPGDCYKYEILGPEGSLLPLKADPLAFAAEHPPHTASVVAAASNFVWADQAWIGSRALAHERTAPISIYEVHLGSWRRNPEQGLRSLTYRELAEELTDYVADLGFTHIELLPITEYPFDGSWGYQPIGLYAPTVRHGSADDFRALVDACHRKGIGVLLDWVPGHFPADAHGLSWFDGTHLYEHADPRQGFQPDWNTLIYNFGRREVANFLLGSALYWMDRFHLDGLRVDAVASMLYLDYSRAEGQWIPNRYGGRENLEAIDFLRRLNELVYGRHPGTFTVAEESTAWPGVSRPTWLGGLGFGYKWNMGWMHDTLNYFSKDSIYRRHHHHQLTFGLLYQYSENFVLPLSHDEVVHGKGSLFSRMPGDRWQKFANLRALYGWMFAHPGKKLLFMGGEFGQEREWNYNASLDWHLLEDPLHQGVLKLIRDLNHLIKSLPALHRLDADPAGFEWLDADDADHSIYAFARYGRPDRAPGEGSTVLVVANLTPVPRFGYRVGVPRAGRWVERLNTDAALYGGSNLGNQGGVSTETIPWHYRPWSLSLTLPPLGVVILEQREE